MNRSKRRFEFTPEKTQAWGLALIPSVILILVVFMVVTKRPITTDIIGLFIGLITAGSLKAAIQKRGGEQRGNDSDSGQSDRDIRVSGREELETKHWRRPNDPDRRNDRRLGLYSY